jgi:MSHA pilin protein MshC
MHLSFKQVETTKLETEHFFGAQAEVWLFGSRVEDMQRGFTLIELIMVMVIVGILAIVVAPRFFDNNSFQSRGFADQVQATLRYAQKEAVAQRRFVCVTLTSASVALAVGTTNTCGTPLAFPTGASIINVPAGSGITMTYTSAGFYFDALGRTATAQTVTVSGATNNIVVEAETGYVHSP